MSDKPNPLRDEEAALALLAEIVAEKGSDYVDPNSIPADDGFQSCKYLNPDGTPSCIVGHYFIKAGSSEADVRRWEYASPYDLYSDPDFHEFDLDLSYPVVSLLQAAQSAQDEGNTWGRALDYARAAGYLS